MPKKKKQSIVEDWELFDPNAEEEEAPAADDSVGGEVDAPKKRPKAEKKPKAAKSEKPKIEKRDKAEKPKKGNTAAKSKPASDKAKPKKKAKPSPEEVFNEDEEKSLIDYIPKKLLPKSLTMTEEELEREKRRKAKRKKQEAQFRQARKQLQKKRKAARKQLAKRDKSKKQAQAQAQAQAQPRRRRGFFGSIWAIFDWFYSLTTNPEEKENRIKPRIFGRTLTYTGFMVLMALLIVLVFLVLNNRTVGVEREEIVVTGLSDDFKGYNILVISDLNGKTFGEDQSTLQRLLSSESYSLVLMLGDMVGPSGDTEPFYDLIDLFVSQRKTVYFIAGDSDPSPLLETPREAGQGLTWREMVLADWVLGAVEHGATYLDCPMSITRGGSKMWLVPDSFLNLNVSDALNDYKDAYSQEQDAYLAGVDAATQSLPLTYYRRNLLDKTRDNIINSVSDDNLIIMLSHEVPSDSQISVAQEYKSETQRKNYFVAPDVVFAGHYCGGEWKLPLIGTLYVDSSILPRYGWFPDENYVQGQRSVGGTVIYTTQGLGNNSDTILRGRLNNPPRVALITLTGELPASFLD